MQTGIKDGKVTMIMSYEEWLEMSEIIQCGSDMRRANISYKGMRSRANLLILEETNKLDIIFKKAVQDELTRIPEYLKTVIRETHEEILPPTIPTIPTSKEVVK